MFLFLSKLLAALFFPLGLACFLSLAALAALAMGRAKWAAGLIAAGFAILYGFSLPCTAHMLLRGLESRYPPATAFPACPAIVILGGAGVPALPPRLHPEINAWGDRLLYGSMLFKQGAAPRVFVTGGKIPFLKDFQGSEAGTNARILTEFFGLDSSVIGLVDSSRNTREDALWTRARFEADGLPLRIILVTSAAHMPRAAGLFRKQGFTVYPAPTDYHADAEAPFKLFGLLPEEPSLYESWYALHEYAGYAVYKALGWL